MVKNYFYLVAGLFGILSAVTHTLHGLGTVLPILDYPEIDSSVRATFTYVWHIIGIENMIFGFVLLIMAFQKDREKVRFTTWVIISILILRWIIIAFFTLKGGSNLMELLIDSIGIFVFVILLFLGTRVKSKIKQ